MMHHSVAWLTTTPTYSITATRMSGEPFGGRFTLLSLVPPAGKTLHEQGVGKYSSRVGLTFYTIFSLILQSKTINSDPSQKGDIPCFSDKDRLHITLELKKHLFIWLYV